MIKLVVKQSGPLKGKVRISGSKNSVLPIIAATLLTDGENIIEEVPFLNDVEIMCSLVESIGAELQRNGSNKLNITTKGIKEIVAPYELVSKLRASFLVMGPLLARVGEAKISMPGGCAIGSRPVDLHLKGFAAMGAEINNNAGYIHAYAKKLKGAQIYLDFPSVGATENILMAACLADGSTIIENASVEPEVVDLANFLIMAGADIKGAGTDTVKITGVKELKATSHLVIPDRIEAGTFMVAAAITQGDVIIENVIPDHLKPVSAKLKECGVEISEELTSIRVKADNKMKAVDIKTLPYPGFPTDMQSPVASLMSLSEGTSVIVETIFENRFMHVSELNRMGANIKIDGRTAVIEGKSMLNGARVKANDLRAGAALVLAGLSAEGTTEVTNAEHIFRGYENIDEKLKSLGADVSRAEEEKADEDCE
ncbi:MAG: UDP-N-acetylglucosamine 1-carboxyvinyltransferase [Deltaproteobacteria bacterium]